MLRTDNPRENRFETVSVPAIPSRGCIAPERFSYAASLAPARPHGLLSGADLRAGYLVQNEVLDALYNRTLAMVLLVAASPILLAICALMKLTTPGPIFYRGVRLG